MPVFFAFWAPKRQIPNAEVLLGGRANLWYNEINKKMGGFAFMKIIRAAYQEERFYAILEGDVVRPLRGLPYGETECDGRSIPLAQVRLLAPCEPSKIVAVGLNYLDHIREMNDPMPEEPVIFLKPPTAVIGPEEAIVAPKRSSRVDFEAELAAVIGKTCKNIAPEEADAYILGYTCLNDVTARDLQPLDGQWTRAKGFDTFAPIGPWIETEFDPDDAPIESVLNGETKQKARTSMMMRGARELVAFASSVMTLLPGDVVSLGTPEGVGPMQPGDRIEIRIGGIGTLCNTVTAQK